MTEAKQKPQQNQCYDAIHRQRNLLRGPPACRIYNRYDEYLAQDDSGHTATG